MTDEDPLSKRVDKVEDKVERVESRVGDLETKAIMTHDQQGRIMSHIESESIMARDDIGKLSKRLFGDDQSKKSGYMGELSHDMFTIKIWVGSVVGAASIITFMIGIWYFFLRVP